MNTSLTNYTRAISYASMGCVLMLSLFLLPMPGGYTWNPIFINLATTLMFLLLVFLTARLAKTDRTGLGVALTGLFIFFFYPGVETFFVRDEQALMDIGSECIVPFFIGQYTRIRRKDFHRWYFMMLLMGIFCSYTHNGVTIPLCAAFLWLSFRHLKGFFHMACWPMVIGFAIGTTLSILNSSSQVITLDIEDMPDTISHMSNNTVHILAILWDTKVFVFSTIITGYLLYGPKGRRMLKHIAHRHYALTVCAICSLLSMPLAPLGIDNTVHGVCFFCMFWLLFVTKYMVERYWHKKV